MSDLENPPPPTSPTPPPPPSSSEEFFSASSSTTTPTSQPYIPIAWPTDGTLTLDWIHNLMDAFDWSSRTLPPSDLPTLLPVEVFDKLVLTASKILHKEANWVRIDESSGLGDDCRVVVVGDVHGQLHDVLFLLKEAGFPGDDRVFVFNGDYVDRGAWGLETFLILLAWKVYLPHRVYLLRGNHESKYCTSVYGFEKEVLTKFGDKGKHVYRKCLGCFEGLPLASIIAGHVYTAHGGLFRSISVTPLKRAKGKKNRKIVQNPDPSSLTLGSLDELLKARRSVLDPPWEGSNLIPGDVLWSDPSMKPGLAPNKERGIGLIWGPDCTEEFLKRFNLKLIIRSHEGPDAREKRPGLGGMDEGYTIDHVTPSGKLITLFSAPDYPQFQATEDRYRNKGAYITLEPPDYDSPIFHSFEAVLPRPKANPFYDFEDVIDSDEELDLASMVTSHDNNQGADQKISNECAHFMNGVQEEEQEADVAVSVSNDDAVVDPTPNHTAGDVNFTAGTAETNGIKASEDYTPVISKSTKKNLKKAEKNKYKMATRHSTRQRIPKNLL